jgi:hypothetical protein
MASLELSALGSFLSPKDFLDAADDGQNLMAPVRKAR